MADDVDDSDDTPPDVPVPPLPPVPVVIPEQTGGIYLTWNSDLGHAELYFASPDPWADIETAIIICLFSDAQAQPDDVLPPGETDRRGWWADVAGQPPAGSRLWLHRRLPRSDASLQLLRADILAALKWLIDDGVAESVGADLAFLGTNGWSAVISIDRGGGARRFDFAWKGNF